MRWIAAGCLALVSFTGNLSAQTVDPKEQLVSFDAERIQLEWRDNHWLLLAGDAVLKDFGRREADARQALRIIRDLGLNQLGTVGSPQPIMEYWLADGRAPTGSILGLRMTPIDLQSLKVDEAQKQWCVRDTHRILFNFGTHSEDARLADAILRKYEFNQIGYVGQGVPSMLVFLGDSGRTCLHSASSLKSQHIPAPDRRGQSLIHRAIPSPKDLDNSQAESATRTPVSQSAFSRTNNHSLNGFPDLAHANAPVVLPHGRQLTEPRSPSNDPNTTADRVSFDWHQVAIKREGQNYQVVLGGHTFADFGQDEQTARKWQSVLQFFHCNEQYLIGQPKPVFSYFLSNGRAPRGRMLGLDGTYFRADDLTVKKVGNDWALLDHGRVLLTCGDKEANAKEAFKAIQRYKFDRLCVIGNGDMPAMPLLLKSN